jgi:hypothetical protein
LVIAESDPSTAAGPAFPGARWALVLGGILLAGLLIIVVCGAIDRGRRGGIERVLQMTAVEDKLYYSVPPAGVERLAVAIRLGGHSLFLASPDPVELHDSEARRVAVDSATNLMIYTTNDLKALPVKERGKTYLLKVETGKYVKVRPSDAANGKQ